MICKIPGKGLLARQRAKSIWCLEGKKGTCKGQILRKKHIFGSEFEYSDFSWKDL